MMSCRGRRSASALVAAGVSRSRRRDHEHPARRPGQAARCARVGTAFPFPTGRHHQGAGAHPSATRHPRGIPDPPPFRGPLARPVGPVRRSWAFITTFLLFLVCWAVLNTVLMQRWGSTLDPYPFIFLNLILSMVAAIQAPIIMMSQNRQSVVDRMAAANDYEVNLRAELGVRALIDRLDELQRTNQEQLDLLRRISTGKEGEPPRRPERHPPSGVPSPSVVSYFIVSVFIRYSHDCPRQTGSFSVSVNH